MIRDIALLWGRDTVVELNSPCREFQVIVVQVCGKRLYEAFRVAGEGTLYSVATTDLEELYTALREACSERTPV
ncbi:MAG TPA: hypothetical protein VF070_22175 [Streptosporangiaceae bacterium]